MMLFFYNLGIRSLQLLYGIASWFNPKAKAFVKGRQQQSENLLSSVKSPGEKLVWVHCASLGEFEQGRPVIEALKQWNPSIKIILTFFSPSGYTVRKNYEHADLVLYLPWDTRRNARRWMSLMSPDLVIFVKYEFWYHFTHQIRAKNIPLLSISAIFRHNQIFFKKRGGVFRSILKCFNHFYVQNKESFDLLAGIDINKATIAGDTRFDRVNASIKNNEAVPEVAHFKGSQKLMVIGSCWPEDMEILYPFINENIQRMKFIIAPHEISESFLSEIEKSISVRSVRYSNLPKASYQDYSVLLIDNVGMLSQLYRYGEFTFVGGGFKQGLHNILEAACYGIPVFFGNKAYKKYQEAVDLVMRGGAFEVGGYFDLKKSYELLVNHPETFLLACEVTKQYVQENLGATEKIMKYCRQTLS